MSEELRDPEVMADIIRRRVLRALVPVVRKLDRVARGHGEFRDDAERYACFAVARLARAVLAPALLAGREDEEDGSLGYHPSHTPERAAELLAKLMRPKHDVVSDGNDTDDANIPRQLEES